MLEGPSVCPLFVLSLQQNLQDCLDNTTRYFYFQLTCNVIANPLSQEGVYHFIYSLGSRYSVFPWNYTLNTNFLNRLMSTCIQIILDANENTEFLNLDFYISISTPENSDVNSKIHQLKLFVYNPKGSRHVIMYNFSLY